MKAPPVPSSLSDTFLVSGGAALDLFLLPVELSGTSPGETQHSKEAHLPEMVQEPLPEPGVLSAAEALLILFPVVGADALTADAATASR